MLFIHSAVGTCCKCLCNRVLVTDSYIMVGAGQAEKTEALSVYMVSHGYTLSPQICALQWRLMAVFGSGA